MQKIIYFFLIISILLNQSAIAQTHSFTKIKLAYGISIDIPSHWHIVSDDNRKNIDAASQGLAENSGFEWPSSRRENLLTVIASPESSRCDYPIDCFLSSRDNAGRSFGYHSSRTCRIEKRIA